MFRQAHSGQVKSVPPKDLKQIWNWASAMRIRRQKCVCTWLGGIGYRGWRKSNCPETLSLCNPLSLCDRTKKVVGLICSMSWGAKSVRLFFELKPELPFSYSHSYCSSSKDELINATATVANRFTWMGGNCKNRNWFLAEDCYFFELVMTYLCNCLSGVCEVFYGLPWTLPKICFHRSMLLLRVQMKN